MQHALLYKMFNLGVHEIISSVDFEKFIINRQFRPKFNNNFDPSKGQKV